MCGILLHKSKELTDDHFIRSLKMLAHRGPDGFDYKNYGKLYIGHTRLSIIDLSEDGKQPMISNCKNYSLSYNGEIYNYQYLKKDLISKGHLFCSNTDSEVILNGFIEYGNNFFEKLNGIFSIIIYDIKLDKITLARDGFGVKPLYYFVNEDEIIVSSEIKVFNDYCEDDPNSKILFLSHGYIPSPNTTLKNVFSLMPGNYAEIEENKISFFKFFDLKTLFIQKNNKKMSKQLVMSAVNNQLLSDAKIGCFLSGGIDSSILSFCVNTFLKEIETYSINFKNLEDERIFQKELIKKYKLINKEKIIGYLDFKNYSKKFINHMDMPTIDGFNTFLVSQLAKENKAKVAFSGVGSDELFFGYPTFKKLGFLKFLKFFSKLIPYSLIPNKYKKLDYLMLDSEYGIYMSHRAVFSISEISKILKVKVSDILSFLNKYDMQSNQNIPELSLIQKIAFYEITKYMEGQLLKDADVYGMANSIEIRVPYLDINLAKAALQIDSKLKLKGKLNKEALIKMFKENIPEKIYNRKKKGFELPYHHWISKSGIRNEIISFYCEKLNLNKAHWSKIWALHILKNKY